MKKASTSIQKIRDAHGVSEYKLANGLRVLYKRESAAPVIAVCVTYHVGSRNEARGHTGSTHILEHLLFKDTKKFNSKHGNSITDYLDWFGARSNATTWLDRTNYFELFPQQHLEEVLELEADRMRNSLFNKTDLETEMVVVRNEYERSRNNPFELLDEELMARAFTEHPYRIPTIGTKEDIENSTVEKLREFYNTFYWPNNATLIVFGNVSWPEAQRSILKHFGPVPSSPHPIPVLKAVEPAQKESRRVTVKKPLGLTIVELGYKIPQGKHPDFAAVSMLGTILGEGFASRLQHSLVDTGLAADIGVSVFSLHDPGIMTITAHVADNVSPEHVLNVMRKEVASLRRKAPDTKEMDRARERILSQMASARDGVFTEMRAVSEWIAAADWTLGYRLETAVKKMKPANIRQVAKTYLDPKRETAGILANTK